jgi:hypothetical protein
MDGEAISSGEISGSKTIEPEVKPLTCVLGFPHNGSMVPDAMFSLTQASQKIDTKVNFAASSLLCQNFNQLWCSALNDSPRPDLFALHHADLCAPPGWLDMLTEEMIDKGADMMGTVVAIKDPRGLTSTAVLDSKTSTLRRVTIREAALLPETFGIADIVKAWELPGDADRYVLCVNSGLWVCRMAPWCETVFFTIGDRIDKTEDGKFVPRVFSEDWLFSADLATKGVKVMCTRKVGVIHFGISPYGTGGRHQAWGRMEHDEWLAV